jgi:hypothetical protein
VVSEVEVVIGKVIEETIREVTPEVTRATIIQYRL